MRSIGVLLVRLVVGGLLAGHGAQKLFGWFGGSGLEGTAGWLESLRLRPGTLWARVAGGSELAGGVLTALGFLNPLGPIAGIGSMAMAWAKVHLGKPVWVTTGGAELPLTNIAVLGALSLAGPGRLSLDSLFGIRIPRLLGLAALGGVLAAVWVGAREELTGEATTVPEEAGIDVEGDPGADPGQRSELAAAAEDAAASESGWPGPSGADAGSAMGSGSALGSETADSFV